MRKLILAVAALCAVVLGVFAARELRRELAKAHEAADAGSFGDEDTGSALQAPTSLTSAPTEIGSRTRPSGLLVLDSTGSPVAGARAKWVNLRGELLEDYISQDLLDWRSINAETVLASGDDQGRIDLPSTPFPESRSAIWVLHPAYVTEPLLVDSGSDSPASVTMREARGIRVRVIRHDEQPSAGAVVTQASYVSSEEERSHFVDAVHAFRQEYEVGADGTVTVDPLVGQQVLWAEQAPTLESERWWGSSPDRVELHLGPTFVVSGRVEAPPEVDLSTATVSTTALGPDFWTGYARLRVSGDGTWGPATVPCLPNADLYIIRAEGPGIVPDEFQKASPVPNEHVFATLHVQAGIPALALVLDVDGNPVADVQVVLSWPADGEWKQTFAHTDAQGLADLGACPPGTIYIEAQHEQHGFCKLGPLQILMPMSEPIVLVLEKSGLVKGRVVHDGKPVENFTVCIQQGFDHSPEHQTFTDRSDGTFELARAPLGSLWIFAFSDALPQGPLVEIDVSETDVVEVVLELPASISGRGSVVDQATRMPISDAQVVMKVVSFNLAWLARGSPFAIDSDGSFEGHSFSPGANTVQVSAPGYAQANITALSSDEGLVDFGVIGLAKRQPLVIRLTRGTQGLKCLATVLGSDSRTETLIPESGVIRFEDMSPSNPMIKVTVGSERTIQRQVELIPGEDWTFDFDVAVTSNLSVEVIPPPGEDLPLGTTLALAYRNVDGEYVHETIYLPESGVAEVWRPDGRDVLVQLDGEGSLLACVEVPGAQHRVRISLDPRVARFRVLRDGEPVAGAVVALQAAGGDVGWRSPRTTDGSGEAAFRGITSGHFVVSVEHAVHGVLPPVPLDFDEALSDGMVLNLDANAAIRVRLVDQGAPLPGLSVLIHSDQVEQLLGYPLSDEQGLARFGPIADGRYRVSISDATVWPVKRTIEAKDGSAPPTVIEVRRRADLWVALVGPGRGGRSVRLQSLSNEGDPAAWLQGGMIVSSPPNMVTDDDGKLRIGGLPHGKYHWSVELASGDSLAGDVTLPPAGVEELRVVVP